MYNDGVHFIILLQAMIVHRCNDTSMHEAKHVRHMNMNEHVRAYVININRGAYVHIEKARTSICSYVKSTNVHKDKHKKA